MPEDDAWDWPVLLYVGTVILRRTEKAFWRMSPRKLNALSNAHIELNSSSEDKPKKTAQTTGYIDQVLI